LFRGVNSINLDAKGRLAIPTRYRERLQERCDGQLVVTIYDDPCLLLYPLPEWEVIERKINRLPTLNARARRMNRLMIGHATECQLDGNGRILLPAPLREFAALQKQVVMIGQGNKFEIWDAERWDVQREQWLKEEAEDDGELPGELESISI